MQLFIDGNFGTNVLCFASPLSIAMGQNPLMDEGSIPLENIT
jgi:hypothetical protein